MALDVWVGDWHNSGSSLVASFEPEAYYWFLESLFLRLEQNHGKHIDLYEGCCFDPQEMNVFEDFVSEAEGLVREQYPQFQVYVGTQTHPVERHLYAEVDREAFLRFLSSLRVAARSCVRASKPLCFYGD